MLCHQQTRSDTDTSDVSVFLFPTKTAFKRYDRHKPAAGWLLVMASRITASKKLKVEKGWCNHTTLFDTNRHRELVGDLAI